MTYAVNPNGDHFFSVAIQFTTRGLRATSPKSNSRKRTATTWNNQPTLYECRNFWAPRPVCSPSAPTQTLLPCRKDIERSNRLT